MLPDAATAQRVFALGVATRAAAAHVPHITLAYDDLVVPLQAVSEVRWTVAALSLIRSVQGQGRYLHEATWPLSAAAADADAAHAGAAVRG